MLFVARDGDCILAAFFSLFSCHGEGEFSLSVARIGIGEHIFVLGNIRINLLIPFFQTRAEGDREVRLHRIPIDLGYIIRLDRQVRLVDRQRTWYQVNYFIVALYLFPLFKSRRYCVCPCGFTFCPGNRIVNLNLVFQAVNRHVLRPVGRVQGAILLLGRSHRYGDGRGRNGKANIVYRYDDAFGRGDTPFRTRPHQHVVVLLLLSRRDGIGISTDVLTLCAGQLILDIVLALIELEPGHSGGQRRLVIAVHLALIPIHRNDGICRIDGQVSLHKGELIVASLASIPGQGNVIVTHVFTGLTESRKGEQRLGILPRPDHIAVGEHASVGIYRFGERTVRDTGNLHKPQNIRIL